MAPAPDTTRRSALTALAVLCAAYLMNSADRQLLAILQEPLADDLGLSDTQLGSLGLYFAVAYAIASFPFAALADRGAVRIAIAGALVVWSAFTVLCGAAQGYLGLALARIGVAIGESGATPASHAVIAQRFPADRRATALSVLMFASVCGGVLAYGVGGYLAAEFGWRWTFVLLGVVGIVIAPVVWLGIGPSPAPERSSARESRGGVQAMVHLFWRQRSLRWLTLAVACCGFSGYGLSQWMGSFLVRETGASLMEAGALMLGVGVTANAAGTLASGPLSDRFTKRDERAFGWLPAIGMLVAAPSVVMMCLAENKALMLIGFAGAQFTLAFCTTPAFALVQRLAPDDRRALAAATIILILTLVGSGGGPMAIGLISDALTAAGVQSSLRYAMLVCAASFAAGAACAALATRWVGRDLGAEQPVLLPVGAAVGRA